MQFHAIFSPSHDSQNPNHFAHCGNPPKTKNKEGYCKKSDLGWSFPKETSDFAKRRTEKRHSLCVMKETKERKIKSRWQGLHKPIPANPSKRPQQ